MAAGKNQQQQKAPTAKPRVIVSGGGTGGHIYPALAIAAALEAELGAEILYMGAKTDLHGGPAREQLLAAAAGYRYQSVTATGLRRKSPGVIKDIITNLRGAQEARALLQAFQPDLVVGTGGYAMAPVLKAATALHIPSLLHEQNAFPGRANRYLAKKVDAICLTFAAAASHFPARARLVTTGLPVRVEIAQADRAAALRYWGIEAAEQLPTLLVTGGSQGARQLNRALAGCYGQLLQSGLRIIHLTGEAHLAECQKAAAAIPKKENLHILPYLKEMHQALAVADLVVGRAGASFLAEIALVGLPAVLVPYPYAANDHQAHNAAAFVKSGAAVLLADADCTAQQLGPLVAALVADAARLQRMREAALGLAKPDAAAEIVRLARALMQGALPTPPGRAPNG